MTRDQPATVQDVIDEYLAAAPAGRVRVVRDETDRFGLYLDTGDGRRGRLIADTEIDVRPLGGHGTRDEALLSLFRAMAHLYNRAQGFEA